MTHEEIEQIFHTIERFEAETPNDARRVWIDLYRVVDHRPEIQDMIDERV